MSIGTIGTSTFGLIPSTTTGSTQPAVASDTPTSSNSQGSQSFSSDQNPLTRDAPKAPTANNGVNSALALRHSETQTDALQNQIRAAREQLNDWVTCVSATTPQGQAEIGSLSAQISAAQDQISHIQQSSGAASVDLWA